MFFKYELLRIIKTKKSIVFMVLLLIIPFMDLYDNYIGSFKDFWDYPEAYGGVLPYDDVLHPTFASFLSANSEGHIAQMLFTWILPLYILIIHSDFYIQEKKLGYISILFSKGKRYSFLLSRFAVSFIVPFMTVFISLMINYLLACILFRGGTEFHSMDTYYMDMHSLFTLSFQHPYIVYFLYIIMYSIIAGGCGIMCTSISLLFPYYKIVYPLCFFIWFMQISNHNSLTYALQPFIEYGWSYIIPALILYFSIVVVSMIVSIRYKAVYDEL